MKHQITIRNLNSWQHFSLAIFAGIQIRKFLEISFWEINTCRHFNINIYLIVSELKSFHQFRWLYKKKKENKELLEVLTWGSIQTLTQNLLITKIEVSSFLQIWYSHYQNDFETNKKLPY